MKARGATPLIVAKRLKVSGQTVKNWQAGYGIDGENLVYLSDYLGVRGRWVIIGGDEPRVPFGRNPQAVECMRVLYQMSPNVAQEWLANGRELIEKENKRRRPK